jgi:glycosyltransferase involved in cell wall biosynthesis
VLLFGRLERYKGIGVLARAMQDVWMVRPDVQLLVCGKGSAKADLPDDPRVEARLEYIPESDVEPIFARATLAVLPYTDASQSGVGTMAIGRGIPTVVSDIGGLPDLAIDASYVVPAGDAPALTEAILRHVDDDDDARSRVLQFADARLGWDAIAQAAERLYRGLLLNRARPASSRTWR